MLSKASYSKTRLLRCSGQWSVDFVHPFSGMLQGSAWLTLAGLSSCKAVTHVAQPSSKARVCLARLKSALQAQCCLTAAAPLCH